MRDSSKLEFEIEGGAPSEAPLGPAAWRVTSGRIEAFLSNSSGRNLIADIEAGGWIFGAAPGHDKVLLVSPEGARLVRDDEGDWRAGALKWLNCAPSDAPPDLAGVATATTELSVMFARRAAARDRILSSRLGAAEDTDEVDPLRVAMGAAARSFGVPVPRAASRGDALDFSDVQAAARAFGLRATRTVLPVDWAASDRGPLLLRGTDGRSVTFARWARGGYRLDSDAFDIQAWRLHGPLAQRTSGLWSQARDVARAVSSDWLLIAGAGLLAGLLGLVVPQAAGRLFDRIVPAGDGGLVIAAGVAMVGAAILAGVFGATRALTVSRARGRDALSFAGNLYDHVLRLPAGFFRAFPAGDLAQRLAGLEALRAAVGQVLFTALTAGIFAAIYLIQLIAFDPRMAAAAILLTLVQVAAIIASRILQARPLSRTAELDGRLAGLTYELLEGIGKLRSAAAEGRMFGRWRSVYAEEREAAAQVSRIQAHYTAFVDAWGILTLSAIMVVAGLAAADGLTPGRFIAFVVAFAAFQAAFTQFSDAVLGLWALQPSAERAAPILAAEPEAAHARNDPGRLEGRISVSGVSFAYPGSSSAILTKVEFEVAAGEHLAIVGGSGSGKSTILRLLLGFEAPLTGLITYDGQDFASLDPSRVRSQIGVVLQASQLFAGTIHENVRGASDASLSDCIEAIEAAGLADDLERLPMGMHTAITEGAGTLSGGQRQRILIARALAGRPRILYFDEATSALDNATQAVVAATLDRLHATRITIAHRLSTVRNADRIAVLEGGRFVEFGDYDTLMKLEGSFARLVRRQLLET